MNRTADRIGRGLMGLDALTTLIPLISGILVLTTVPDDRIITEAWRTFAYAVFVGLWAVLAIWPRTLPGLWEVLIFQKTAITVFSLAMLSKPEAAQTAVVDSILVVTTVAAYILCRGWTPWQQLKR
jgi:hypothetical protein